MGANCYYHLPFQIPSHRVTVTGRQASFYCASLYDASQMWHFLQIEDRTFYHQKAYDSLYCGGPEPNLQYQRMSVVLFMQESAGLKKHGEDGLAVFGAE